MFASGIVHGCDCVYHRTGLIWEALHWTLILKLRLKMCLGLAGVLLLAKLAKMLNIRQRQRRWRRRRMLCCAVVLQIWMNINFMALSALKHYASQPGPHMARAVEVHAALQAALTQVSMKGGRLPCTGHANVALSSEPVFICALQNVAHQYQVRGYLFEQYDDVNGRGTSSHPFTGWTALITLIATGTY